MADKRKVFAYMRVSTETQVEKGYGLDVQKEEILKYAKEHDIAIEEWYIDAGISGTKVDRPALTELLVALARESRPLVLCLNTTRLWRSDVAGGFIRYNLTQIGADVISVQEPNYTLYSDDPSDFLINQIMQALAQYDRMLVNQKLSSGRRMRAKNGDKACGNTPLGYTWDSRKVAIDKKEQKIVTFIFETYASEKSFQRVADLANARRYRTRNGNTFTRQAIRSIVSNDFYAGIVTYDGVKREGNHPALISWELFLECNPGYVKETEEEKETA